MPLPTNLNTNEVKDAAGAEQEFLFFSKNNREVIYAISGESPSTPHRIRIAHSEFGSGVSLRRRSVQRIDKNFVSEVDGESVVRGFFQITCDLPIGHMTDYDEAKTLAANSMSLFASLGATTTILYDCTGYGAAALVNGTL